VGLAPVGDRAYMETNVRVGLFKLMYLKNRISSKKKTSFLNSSLFLSLTGIEFSSSMLMNSARIKLTYEFGLLRSWPFKIGSAKKSATAITKKKDRLQKKCPTTSVTGVGRNFAVWAHYFFKKISPKIQQNKL
jgi:hypothetical protein